MTEYRRSKKYVVECSVCGEVERFASDLVAGALEDEHKRLCAGDTEVRRLRGGRDV